ncbi:hypothetical protein [Maridesulfovibrio hydrothermalis]
MEKAISGKCIRTFFQWSRFFGKVRGKVTAPLYEEIGRLKMDIK